MDEEDDGPQSTRLHCRLFPFRSLSSLQTEQERDGEKGGVGVEQLAQKFDFISKSNDHISCLKNIFIIYYCYYNNNYCYIIYNTYFIFLKIN